MPFVDRARACRALFHALATLMLLICISSLAAAQPVMPPASNTPANATPAPSGLPLVVNSPLVDLGELALGATGHGAIFRITNTGEEPVTLAFGRLPEGLSPRKLDTPLAPGGSGVAVVDIDTYRLAALDSPFTITTSSQAQPRLELVVRAKVRAYVQPSPPTSRFNFVQFERPGSTVHTVFATDTPDLVVTNVSSPMPFITASFVEVPAAEREAEVPGRQWRVVLTIARDAPVGPIGGFVTVTTSHAKQPTTLLPVSGFVRPQFAVTPPSLTLGDVRHDASAPTLTTLVVKNFATAPIDIRSATVDVAGLVVVLSTGEPGRSWRVSLQSTDALQPGPFAGTIRLTTASPDTPELRIPVSGTAVR